MWGQNCTLKALYITSPQRDPHQEHEEDEEDIGDKVHRAQDSVGIVDGIVVKIPKDYPELSETEKPDLGFMRSQQVPQSIPHPTFLTINRPLIAPYTIHPTLQTQQVGKLLQSTLQLHSDTFKH